MSGEYTCREGERCSNNPGSFTCVRFDKKCKIFVRDGIETIGRFATCGTGYTLNYDSGECEVRMIAKTKKVKVTLMLKLMLLF